MSYDAICTDKNHSWQGKDMERAFEALKNRVDLNDKKNAKTTVFNFPRGMTIINKSGLYILTGLTNPNFGVSKSHCFHDKMVY